MLTDDDEILASAQQRLLARRAAMTTGGQPAPLAEAAARVAPIDPRIVRRIDHAHPAPTAADRVGVARAVLRREIPDRFTWARWGELTLDDRVAGGAAKVEAARRALATMTSSSSRVVLVGPAGSGKTSIACAHLAELAFAGAKQPRFVAARNLLGGRAYAGANGIEPQSVPWAALALAADPLVLDDLGAELAGAPAGGGLAAQRIEVVCRVLADRHDRDLGHVVTTAHERAAIASMYGDGVARRVFEGALVIRCKP